MKFKENMIVGHKLAYAANRREITELPLPDFEFFERFVFVEFAKSDLHSFVSGR